MKRMTRFQTMLAATAGLALTGSMLAWAAGQASAPAPTDAAAAADQPAKYTEPTYRQGQPVYGLRDPDKKVVGEYRVPADTEIAEEPNADLILYGKRLHNETARLLPANVGASVNCSSCHLGQGKVSKGAHYFNAIAKYPQLMPRAGKEVDIEGRVNGCFQRSMNGKPLDRDSREMKAMVAYMAWLGQGMTPKQTVATPSEGPIDQSLVPNPDKGKAIYAAQCASCHGEQGQGTRDQFGDIIFPPLWGDESFNIGAGLARTYKAASFVYYNMPMGVNRNAPLGQGSVLTQQEAVDVAEYFTHMPRPDFAGKVNDWPNGKKPKDARY